MKIPLHISEVPSEVWYAGTDREIRGKPLCDIGGAAKVGVGYLELPPGSHTKPGHWHLRSGRGRGCRRIRGPADVLGQLTRFSSGRCQASEPGEGAYPTADQMRPAVTTITSE